MTSFLKFISTIYLNYNIYDSGISFFISIFIGESKLPRIDHILHLKVLVALLGLGNYNLITITSTIHQGQEHSSYF